MAVGKLFTANRRRCQPGYFQCGTGHCLQESRHCDGIPDCPDASDERKCSKWFEPVKTSLISLYLEISLRSIVLRSVCQEYVNKR